MIYSVLAVLGQGRRPLPSEGKSGVKAFFRNQVVVTKGRQTRRSDQPAAYLSRSST